MTSPPAAARDALIVLVELLAEQIAAHLKDRLTEGAMAEHGAGSPWMSINTAAVYLDWPRQRLYKLTAQAAIPHYKQDGRLLFHRRELDQWLSGYRQPGGDWMPGANRAISR